jgi:pimeloyl-[acyl-carrier protein] methyl ester esterase
MLPRFVGGFNRGDARAKEVSRQLLELADPRPPLATLATGLDWLRDVDLRRLAPQIKAPTLLIHGAADPLMPLAAAEALAALIPRPNSPPLPTAPTPRSFPARKISSYG